MGGTGKPPTGDQWIEMDEVDLKTARGPPPRPPPKPITQVNQSVQELEGSYKYCFNLIFVLIIIIAAGIAILLIALIPLGNIDTDTDIHVTNEGNTYIRGDGIVASDSEICSRIGLAIMRDKNGNAVDAAVATSFCLGVVNPYSSGLGGGGVMMIHMASRSPSPSATPSNSPTPSQTPSNAPTPSETPSVTPTPDPSNSETPTPTPSSSETPSGTPLATPSNTPSASVLPSPDATPGPSPDPAPAPAGRSLEMPVKSVEQIRREQLSRQRNGRSAAARAADPIDWIPAWDTHDILLDYMEVAPAAATADMFNGNSGASKVGGKSVAVPGELRGLYEAWYRWGSGLVSWEELVMPSVDMANDMQVTAEMAVVVKEYENVIRANRKLSTIYVQNGTLVQKGDRIQRPDLSAILGAIAVSNGDELYVGPFAKQIVEDVVDAGGILTEADLADYRPRYRTLISSTYRGNKVLTAPPPFSGVCLSLGLNILDGFTLHANSSDSIHNILEAFKFMFADRMALGDPDFVENIDYYVSQMLNKEHANDLRLKIQANTTFPPSYYSDLVPISQPASDSGTTHFVIVDPSGNVVSATSSINSPFGSQVLSGGVTLNNAMDSFSTAGFSNSDQIPPSENNKIAPKKRPLTSMAPTIIFDPYGAFKLALGASGGSMITTSVLQTVVNVIDFAQELPDAIGASRLHNQLIPEDVIAEKGYSEGVLSNLSTMGYPITRIGKDLVEHIGVVQAIERIDGKYEGVSDIYRKTGMPASYKN